MNEYQNPMYEPRIHDFGDDYHQPDVTLDLDNTSMAAVKKIRRRYQNWFDYQDACTLYDAYVSKLKEKYGGDAQLRLAMLLGKVREYIPNYPQLRKNKRNRYYRKNRIPRETEHEFTFEPVPIEELNKLPKAKVKVRLDGSKKINMIYDSTASLLNSSIAQITNELDMLNAYFIRTKDRIERMKCGKKKKKRLKRNLNRKTVRMSLEYRSISDMLALHEKRKRDKFFNRDEENTNLAYYKGSFVSLADQNQLDVTTRLKNLGVVFSKLTKSRTKLIRKKLHGTKTKSEKKRRKKMKKNAKLESKFIRKISNDRFNDYKEFETAMSEMTSSRRFDKY